jgi:hypothetical protein
MRGRGIKGEGLVNNLYFITVLSWFRWRCGIIRSFIKVGALRG